MALEISDFNGTVTAPSVTYPHGNIKDNPSGTIIDVTSNGDLQQTAQEAMLQGGITPNNLPDNATNGYQVLQGLAKISSNMGAAWIINQIGRDYNPASFYILSGSATRSADGVGFFGGQIYEIHGNAGPVCGGGLVDVLNISTTEMENGMMVANVVCAASGSGAANFADVVYVSKWAETGLVPADFAGTITVDPADIEYARYLRRGRTVHLQIRVRDASFSGGGAMSISLPFLPSNTFANPYSQLGAVYTNAGNWQVCKVDLINSTPCALSITSATGFVAGTDDSDLDVNIVFETTT